MPAGTVNIRQNHIRWLMRKVCTEATVAKQALPQGWQCCKCCAHGSTCKRISPSGQAVVLLEMSLKAT